MLLFWCYYQYKKINPDNIKIDEKSYKNIFSYCIGYVKIKDSKYVKINCVISLYLIFSIVNGYFEKINKNKYLMLDPTEKSWWKIMKIKFNSNDQLPLNKTIEIPSMIIVARAVFNRNNKFYPQVLLDEHLYKL